MLHSGVLPQENLKHYTIGSYIQGSRCLKEVPILENDATIKGKIEVLHWEQGREIVKIQTCREKVCRKLKYYSSD